MLQTHRYTYAALATTSLVVFGLFVGCTVQRPPPPEQVISVAHDPAATTAPQFTPHPAVSVAQRMIGKPYRYGGDSPRQGFDCSGLIHFAFREAGLRAPRTTQAMYENAFAVEAGTISEGDLLFFHIDGKVSHVALYVGDNVFVHAPSSGKSVSYDSLDNPYWRERLVKVGRLF